MARVFYLILFITISVYGHSQSLPGDHNGSSPDEMEHKIVAGGSLGFQFGSIMVINVNPILGYRITPLFTGGGGFIYQHFRDRRYSTEYSTNVYGGRLFLQHDLFRDIYAYGEYEYLMYEGYDRMGNIRDITSQNMLVGGGYKQWFSQRAYAYIQLLYNLNETIHTPYSNPVFRTGFLVRF